jgi:hypothetical protein
VDCPRHSIVDGNERNGRGRCSLQSGHRHVRILMALVGGLVEPGALGGSDGGGTSLSWCAVVFEVVLRSCAGYFLFHVSKVKVHQCV